jgi:hypothetical protein
MQARGFAVMMRQRLAGQTRAEVGAADADADDIGDPLQPEVLRAFTHGVGQCAGTRQRRRDGLGDRRTRSSGDRRRAQRRVQNRALLRAVDRLATEHGVAVRADARLFGVIEQGLPRRCIDRLPRNVEQQRTQATTEALRPVAVAPEQFAQTGSRQARGVDGKRREIGLGHRRVPGWRGRESIGKV